eukprot:5298682-Pyramimonas_sp.AAC.1
MYLLLDAEAKMNGNHCPEGSHPLTLPVRAGMIDLSSVQGDWLASGHAEQDWLVTLRRTLPDRPQQKAAIIQAGPTRFRKTWEATGCAIDAPRLNVP